MKKKLLGLAIVLAMVAAFIVPMTVSAASSIVALYASTATAVGAVATTAQHYIGAGSWQALGGSSGADDLQLYISPTTPPFSGLGSFTLSQIANISYATYGETPGSVNFFVNIYTTPYSGGEASWYGARLTGEPMYSNDYSDTTGAWNLWKTTSGTNQLTFYDNNVGTYVGFAGAPTLADLQEAGKFNWGAYPSGTTYNSVNYSNQTVQYITLATANGDGGDWAGFAGYLDDITITLTNGNSLTIDLEDTPSAGVGESSGTNISGTVALTNSILSLTAPSAITNWNLGDVNGATTNTTLEVGDNYGVSATPGTVSFTQGNDGVTGWQVTAACESGYSTGASGTISGGPIPSGGLHGNMYYSGTFLSKSLGLSTTGSTGTFTAAGTPITYSGTGATGSLPLYGEQTIITTDPPGNYGIIIIFTVSPQL
jgi:hypothetical protein